MKEVLIITEPEIVKVLSDETRFKILQLLRMRPMTISELSEALERDRTTVYRHIKILEKAGLITKLESQGNEKVYSRSAKLFLIKADPDEGVEQFRQAYLQVEAERLVRIMEMAGFRIKNRAELVKLTKQVLNEIEIHSQPVLKRISQAGVELTEVELFHLLNMLVFLQSCELCGLARRVRKLVDI